MRLSISYNYFNGDEHLSASMKSVCESAFHISVVWQATSNAGEPMTEPARQALIEAQELPQVEAIEFRPDLTLKRRRNELEKRRIGLAAARRAGATHFLSMDADEFYRPRELANALAFIERHWLTSTSVDSYLHIRRPIWRGRDTTRVAFVTRLLPWTRIGAARYPVERVDSTRRMQTWPMRHRHFSPDLVAMYHMNLVRRDLSQKLRNSSTEKPEFLDAVGRALTDWRPPQPFRFPGRDPISVERVPNEFGTWDPEAGA